MDFLELKKAATEKQKEIVASQKQQFKPVPPPNMTEGQKAMFAANRELQELNAAIQEKRGELTEVTVTVKMTNGAKEQLADVLNSLGIDIETAVKLFFKQIPLRSGLPFPITTDPSHMVTKHSVTVDGVVSVEGSIDGSISGDVGVGGDVGISGSVVSVSADS
jgi:antitoxin component of RelBE/YafQ-DinJ toxin-antitoxin module